MFTSGKHHPSAPIEGISNKSNRLVSTTLWVTGVTLAFVALVMTMLEFTTERSDFLDTLRSKAQIVAEHASASAVFHDRRAAIETLTPLRMDNTIREAEIRDLQTTLAGVSFLNETWHDSIIGKLGLREERFADYLMMEVYEPIVVDDREVGKVILRASMANIYRSILSSLFTYFLILLVTLSVAYVVLRKLRREIQDAEIRLAQQAHFDGVTGLPNRNAFNAMLSHVIGRAKRDAGAFALIYLDLDNFKLINDTMGHAAGDQLLYMVGERMGVQLREGDSIYRLGGDEFTIIADPCTDSTAAAALAERLTQALYAPFMVFGEQVHVTISIGISMYPIDASNVDTLVRNADTAMYHAKELGKNNFQFFSAFMEERARTRMALEKAMRGALEQEEFFLLYQPLVDLNDGRFVGCEALLRWQSSDRGRVAPDDFIPLAEETGFIVPLGEHVLRQACQQIKSWNEKGLGDIHINVNLSGRQLYEANFTRLIRDLVRETGIDPGWLELEITESMLMENIDQVIQRLHELRSLGVSLTIDDFGTGYSSMSYLKRLPVSKLKIDQSFVHDIAVDKDAAAIASAIIALGHSLGLSVVAEGVETKAQVDILRRIGCDMAQGYYFGHPVDAGGVEAVMRGLATH